MDGRPDGDAGFIRPVGLAGGMEGRGGRVLRGALGRTAGAPPPIHGQATLFSGPGRTPPRHPDPYSLLRPVRGTGGQQPYRPPADFCLRLFLRHVTHSPADVCLSPHHRDKNERYGDGGRAPPDRCFFRPTPNSEFLQRPTAFAAIVSSIFHFTRANVLPFCSIGNDDFVMFSFQTSK